MKDLVARLARPGAVAVGGVPEGYDAVVLAELASAAGPGGMLHVCRDDARMASLAEALAFFAPELAVVEFPAWDCLPYDRVSPNASILGRRMAALARLAQAPVPLVLTTVNAILQRVLPSEVLRRTRFTAAVGEKVAAERLIAYLAGNGYTRLATANEPGEFAVRGGIVDLFPPGAEMPYRLDFFGDTIEAIRRYDPLTQRSIDKIERIELAPGGEAWLDAASIGRFRSGYMALFGAAQADDPLYASVVEGKRYLGMEHWLPLFHERLATLFDYVPKAALSFDHLAEEARVA
ncbi:MAG: transcription-repair coupling factor, partial [Alphaproteobacteria bacterium]|nr:transcription-repair coupling factor [Alphaproteobacteria bacterium]